MGQNKSAVYTENKYLQVHFKPLLHLVRKHHLGIKKEKRKGLSEIYICQNFQFQFEK